MKVALCVWAILLISLATLSFAESVSIKEYVDKQMAQRDRALDLAYDAMNIRLNGMNEFREQLRMQAATFVPRTEVSAMDKKVTDIDLGST
jgi:hypothetical protein